LCRVGRPLGDGVAFDIVTDQTARRVVRKRGRRRPTDVISV
jgi:hypothetical protein